MRWPKLFRRNAQHERDDAPFVDRPAPPRFLPDPKTPIQQIKYTSLTDFVSAKPRAVLLLYADWDGNTYLVLPQFLAMVQKFADIEFGQVRLDEHSQSLFAEFGIMNVPAVAFFADGQLQNVAYGKDAIAELNRLS